MNIIGDSKAVQDNFPFIDCLESFSTFNGLSINATLVFLPCAEQELRNIHQVGYPVFIFFRTAGLSETINTDILLQLSSFFRGNVPAVLMPYETDRDPIFYDYAIIFYDIAQYSLNNHLTPGVYSVEVNKKFFNPEGIFTERIVQTINHKFNIILKKDKQENINTTKVDVQRTFVTWITRNKDVVLQQMKNLLRYNRLKVKKRKLWRMFGRGQIIPRDVLNRFFGINPSYSSQGESTDWSERWLSHPVKKFFFFKIPFYEDNLSKNPIKTYFEDFNKSYYFLPDGLDQFSAETYLGSVNNQDSNPFSSDYQHRIENVISQVSSLYEVYSADDYEENIAFLRQVCRLLEEGGNRRNLNELLRPSDQFSNHSEEILSSYTNRFFEDLFLPLIQVIQRIGEHRTLFNIPIAGRWYSRFIPPSASERYIIRITATVLRRIGFSVLLFKYIKNVRTCVATAMKDWEKLDKITQAAPIHIENINKEITALQDSATISMPRFDYTVLLNGNLRRYSEEEIDNAHPIVENKVPEPGSGSVFDSQYTYRNSAWQIALTMKNKVENDLEYDNIKKTPFWKYSLQFRQINAKSLPEWVWESNLNYYKSELLRSDGKIKFIDDTISIILSKNISENISNEDELIRELLEAKVIEKNEEGFAITSSVENFDLTIRKNFLERTSGIHEEKWVIFFENNLAAKNYFINWMENQLKRAPTNVQDEFTLVQLQADTKSLLNFLYRHQHLLQPDNHEIGMMKFDDAGRIFFANCQEPMFFQILYPGWNTKKQRRNINNELFYELIRQWIGQENVYIEIINLLVIVSLQNGNRTKAEKIFVNNINWDDK